MRRGVVFGGATATLSLWATPVEAEFAWRGGARAAVSLTYDDGYSRAYPRRCWDMAREVGRKRHDENRAFRKQL